MTIEPQSVEPGFAKRWTLQSIALIFRSPIVWAFVILSYFLASKMINHSIWFLFLGGFLLMLSLEFAAFTDFKKMNVNSFFQCIKIASKYYINTVKEKKVFLFIFVGFILIVDSIVMASISKETKAIPTPLFSSVMFSVMLGYIFLNAGSHLQFFSYPIKRAFESDETEAISATCLKASLKNPGVYVFFELGIFMSMVILGTFLPFLGLFYAAFLPCLIYVAFREIFWGKRENQKQEEISSQTSENLALIEIKD